MFKNTFKNRTKAHKTEKNKTANAAQFELTSDVAQTCTGPSKQVQTKFQH